ncbi:MAG: FAD-binding protein [Candidatus Tectomicrobia bacterium]|nr:FAD-binding protein [Candidatus Tectomicrobia bacterium]
MHEITTDILVIGGGLAGCQAAVRARQLGCEVAVMEKSYIHHSGAACMGLKDMVVYLPGINTKQSEMALQKRATHGLNDETMCELILDGGAALVDRLESWGIQVRNDEGELVYDQSMFGGCNLYIWNGKYLKKGHARQVKKSGAHVFNRVMMTDLLVEDGAVVGAVGFHTRSGEAMVFHAKATILASGDCVRMYQAPAGENFNRWRNPYHTGDGYAAALRAGARLKHMEFVQGTLVPKDFTAPGINAFIGVGAKLYNARGERFMGEYAGERMEKSPRQLLAYAVFSEIKEGRGPIFMDFRDLDRARFDLVMRGFENEKPTYFTYFKERHIDLKSGMMELEVSEPYSRGELTGGVDVDSTFGLTLPGLFGVGDATAYGSWSAASGAMILGWEGAARACAYAQGLHAAPRPSTATVAAALDRLEGPGRRPPGMELAEIERNLQRIMTSYAGYERNETSLRVGLERIRKLQRLAETEVGARDVRERVKAHEILNMLEVAETIILAAKERKESRMFLNHRRTDYPERDDKRWLKHLLVQKQAGRVVVSERAVG